MKKSLKDQTTRAFQTGGYNPPAVPQPTQPYSQPTQVDPRTGTYTLPGTGIAGYQIPAGTPTGYVPYGGATPYFQPVQFTGAQYQDPLQTTNLPTFADTVGDRPGQYDELRTYINDAGQTLQIPFKDGKPIYPIPEGYRPIGDQPAPEEEEEQVTVAPTLGETTVRDDGGRDDADTISTTTRASRNVAAGYTKGYGNLSTTSRGGGLSPAAQQAVSDLGITGRTGMPAGGILGGIANAFGFDVPSAFGREPTQGMTGNLSQGQLEAIARGAYANPANFGALSPEDIPSLSTQQALNVMAAEQNYGVTLSGSIGYGNGDINPVTGTPMRNGMAVDSAFGPGATPAQYGSISDMLDTISRGTKAGWRGGYISAETYSNLSDKAKANYDKFDNTHKSDDTGFSGTSDKSAADFGKADVATGKGGGVRSEDLDAAVADDSRGDSPSSPSGDFGAGQSTRGDPSDTGKSSGGDDEGGHTGGSAADGSGAQSDGYGGLGH